MSLHHTPNEAFKQTGNTFIPLFFQRQTQRQKGRARAHTHLQVASLGELGAELVRQLEVVLTSMKTPDDVVNVMDAMG